MIGAALILLGLVLVFLTRPRRNKKRKPVLRRPLQNPTGTYNVVQSLKTHYVNTDKIMEHNNSAKNEQPGIEANSPAEKIRKEIAGAIVVSLTQTMFGTTSTKGNEIGKVDNSLLKETVVQIPNQEANHKYHNYNRQNPDITFQDQLMTTLNPTGNQNDIIDIDKTIERIKYDGNEHAEVYHVPYWPHKYIYDYSDLKEASEEQRNFYDQFKVKFLTGKYIDLLGNSNYAFVLLFDLLKQSKVHKNLRLLEEQLDTLSENYHKTAPYARRFLIDKMRDAGDYNGIERIQEANAYNNHWDWRGRFKSKLKLNAEDSKFLDEVWISNNKFMSMDSCAVEVVKLYVGIMKRLKSIFSQRGINFQDQLNVIMDLIARKIHRYHLGSQNYNYFIGQNSYVFQYLVSYCEQAVRDRYLFNRKVADFALINAEAAKGMNENIMSHVERFVAELLEEVAPLTEVTEIHLNAYAPTRWKVKYDLSEAAFQEKGKEVYFETVTEAIRMNQQNPSLEFIYLEVSKSLVKLDKQLSFEYYLRYVAQNLNSGKLVLKVMSQATVKKLFTVAGQATRFYELTTLMIKKEINLEKSLLEIQDFFLPPRKKIVLSSEMIKQVENEHSETVKVLNEYLSEEDIITEKEVNETAKVSNEMKSEQVDAPENPYGFDANPAEVKLLGLFKELGYSLTEQLLDDFCKAQGTMKGPLINNLNEQCYEIIDDLLIENDESQYTINPTYYQQIISV